MKISPTVLNGCADITRVSNAGQVRRLASQALLALLRKELSATDAVAAAKLVSAVNQSMDVEIKLMVAKATILDKSGHIVRSAAFGATLIGDHDSVDAQANHALAAG